LGPEGSTVKGATRRKNRRNVRGVVLLGEGFGVGDEGIGLLFEEGEEVLALDAEGMIDKAIEVGVVTEGEVAPEEEAIQAAENGADGAGELDDKSVVRRPGVLLQGVLGQHHSGSRTPL
jgi:hypothetical protein